MSKLEACRNEGAQHSHSTGIILLAAGESRRFGSPKQLANWQGKPLLRHAAETALHSALGPVNVVVGAVDGPCRDALQGLDVTIIHNARWKEGMGSSVVAGLVPWEKEDFEGVIIMLGDQPRVTSVFLRSLYNAAYDSQSHEPSIVASSYSGQLGVPAWFSSMLFSKLLALQGEKGARSLIMTERNVFHLDAPDAAYDIDTPADLLTK